MFKFNIITTRQNPVVKYTHIVNLLQHLNPNINIEDNTNNNLRRIRLECNWTDSKTLCNLWNKMSKNNNFQWDNIQIVSDGDFDYTVIINMPSSPNFKYDPSKTIVFKMEPLMDIDTNKWGDWGKLTSINNKLNDREFLKVFSHDSDFNNNEWHLSKTYQHLSKYEIVKEPRYFNVLSTILSGKYRDHGQIKRVDFIKFLEMKNDVCIHVYGDNRFDYKNYMKPLPMHCKDEGLFPYKYSFNAENNNICNYYTEKLIDGILTETLTFYWGCINIIDLIDPRAYVLLDENNFEKSYNTIKYCIQTDMWSQRIEYIRAEKHRILNELQFFPRLENFILNHEAMNKSLKVC